MSRKDYTMRAEIRDNKFFTAVKVTFKTERIAEVENIIKSAFGEHLFFGMLKLKQAAPNKIEVVGIVDNSLAASGLLCMLREQMTVL